MRGLVFVVGLAGGVLAMADETLSASQVSGAGMETEPISYTDVSDVHGLWTEGVGRVAWQTGAAWGTAGFRVYRVDPATGAETLLNATLVPVAFSDPAATYAVIDPEAAEGGDGLYRLEETKMSGEAIDLGTYAVVFALPPPPARTPRTATILALPKTLEPSDALKVSLREEGIYGVALESIATGMGIGFEDAQALAAEGLLEIAMQGRPVPAIYDAARDRLVFHGAPSTNWYARENAYLIQGAAGTPMPRRAPNAATGVATLPAEIRFEEDVFPFNGAVERPDDFYYWNFVISAVDPATNRVDFPFVLDGYGGGELTLRVDVQGWSKTTTRNPDHCAEYYLNGTLVGTNAFDDQLAATATLAIPLGVASNGANVLTIRGALTNASQYSYFVVDGFTAEYDRQMVPGAGTAFVRAGGAAAVSAAAFADPLALALDEDGNPTWIADENGGLPSKAWATASTNERFVVVEADAVPLLVPVPAAADAWFMAETNRIDYLVLTSRALAPAAQGLADYRAGQGLRVGLATFEDVCDLLAGGLRTPEAIPALMRYAAARWPESPRMLVLAGNGHYDYLESLGTEPNHLPPLLRQTYDGLFSSDERMGDVGGDELPDVAVGRLPACTAEELSAMVAKIQAYEAEAGEAWQSQLAFANDAADAAGDFAASVARFTNLVSNPFSVSARADLDVQTIAPARAAFLGAFSNGAGVVHYTGHGTTVKLSTQGLLTTTDVGAMTNALTPFTALLCCLAGHFDAPAVNSLGELLMQRGQGGAVSVWASSALPLNAPATDLGEAFYRRALQDRKGPVGRALLEARRSLPGDIFTKNTYATYNLLGDPALRILDNDPATVPDTAAQIFLNDLFQPCDFTPRAATATTLPAGLAVKFTYDGQPAPPSLPGSYAVTAVVATAYYAGSATGTLVVAKVPAAVALADLAQIYDGTPKSATATTEPAGLAVRCTYSGVTNPPTAAGNYWVVALVDDPVWQGGASGILAVAKAPAAVALNGLSQTYDGTPRVVTATTDPAGLTVGLTYNGSSNAPTGAGSYVVTAKVVSANYAGLATGTLAVAKAPAAVTLNGLAQTYDGTPRVVTATTVPDELAVDIRYDGTFGAPTAAGTYAVSGTVSDPNWQGLSTGALVVAPAAQTIDFPPIADQWTTNVVQLAATASSGLPVSFAVASGPGVIAAGTVLTFVGAGAVEIVATQEGGGNWTAAAPVLRTVAVSYSLPIPEISAWTIPVRESGEGRLHVRLPSKGSAVVDIARIAGSTNLTIQSGAVLTFKTANWNVYQTVTLAAAADANADGETATFRISSPGFSDLLVTAIALDDDIGPNLALASGGATIAGSMATNAALAIDGVHTSSAAAASTIWTGTPPGTLTLDLQTTTTVSRVRLLNPDWTFNVQQYRLEGSRDGADWEILVDASQDEHAGWEDWTLSGVARYLRFTGLSNSASPSVALAEWEVYGTPWSKAAATVSLGNLAQTYDGTPKSATIDTVPEGLEVEVTYGGQTNPPSSAGLFEVIASVVDPDYAGSATGTLAVAPQVELLHLEQTYDGAPKTVDVQTAPGDAGVVAVTYDGQSTPPVDAGSYVVAAEAVAGGCSGFAEATLIVAKASQTIDFPDPGDQISTNVLVLAATASSGLPVEYVVRTGPATIIGTTVSFAGAGFVEVEAQQPGDGNWAAAKAVVRGFDVALPAPAPELSAAQIYVREGGEGRFFVRLDREPTGEVAVAIQRDSGDEGIAVQGAANLTFQPSDWNVWQAVVLTADEDANAESETARFHVSAAGAADHFAEAATLDDEIGENLALSARGTELAGRWAFQLPQLTDGIHASSTNYGFTVWTSVPPGEITMDLQGVATVSRLRVLNWDWTYRSHQYRIEASADGVDWTLLVQADDGEHRGWEDWPVADVPVRYLRFTGLSNSANAAVCIAEWEVYGPSSLASAPRPEMAATRVNVREAGEGRVYVRLDRPPETDVEVTVGRSEGSADLSVQVGGTLTFTPASWNAWQAVTLAAGADANAADETAIFRLSAPGTADRFLQATALDDDIGDNLALASGGTSISGTKAYLLPQAIDGVHAERTNYAFTVWTNLQQPGTMTLDLQAEATLTRVRLLNWDWSLRAHRYRIESSLDGAAWTLLADASDGEHRGWEDWPVEDVAARYLRFTGLSNSANSAVCISEWEVYGERAQLPQLELSSEQVNVREAGEGRLFVRLDRAPAITVTAVVSRVSGEAILSVQSGTTLEFRPTTWNVWQAVTLAAAADDDAESENATFRISLAGAEDRFAVATALDDDIGENLALASGGTSISGTKAYLLPLAIDGVHNQSTNYAFMVWTNLQQPGTMTLDLQMPATVSRVRLLNYDWSFRSHQYIVESSLDGANWTLLADASVGDHRGWEDWPAADVAARYLRFTALSNSANSAVCIAEWEVYGVRAPSRRSVAVRAEVPHSPPPRRIEAEPFPLTVVTSDDGPEHTNGWAAIDGDPDTCWAGRAGAGGWYIAVGYDSTLVMTNLEVVLAEGSSTRMQCLTSLDGEEWREWPEDASAAPVEANYLWLLFPGEGEASPEPRIVEILPQCP